MNVLFLTLVEFESFQERNIYTDLLREFIRNGDTVYAISPTERRKGQATHLVTEGAGRILRLQTGNTQKTNIVEKGISTIMIEPLFRKAIKEYFSDIRFDLVLYSTPPITLVSAVEEVKKRDGAKSYLLLKDIFPQNAVDIGMMSTDGAKGMLYRHFRKQEKRLYAISDRIGCMSAANAAYVIKHNPEIDPAKVEVCPNAIEPTDKSVDPATRDAIRKRYGIPGDRTVFVYGGNLGKPQGIPFLIECLEECRDIEEAYFLIVGDGTEYPRLEAYAKSAGQENLKLMQRLPKEDYDTMVGACDVGMIFLDYRFTIPNFPSRMLSYMQAKIPILACTDPNTDIGRVIEEGGFGWRCESRDAEQVKEKIREILRADLKKAGENGWATLQEKYTAAAACRVITEGTGAGRKR